MIIGMMRSFFESLYQDIYTIKTSYKFGYHEFCLEIVPQTGHQSTLTKKDTGITYDILYSDWL